MQDAQNGLSGEIVFVRSSEGATAERKLVSTSAVIAADNESESNSQTLLLRGGFLIGRIPGLPNFILSPGPFARIEAQRDPVHPHLLPATDLARSKLIEEPVLASAIFQIWLTALLKSLNVLEKRPIGHPHIQRDLLRAANWLEAYSAFDLYRLSKSSWLSWLSRHSSKKIKALAEWEAGRDEPIVLEDVPTADTLHWHIFELILPKFTELKVHDRHYYLTPLRKGWKRALKNWHTFVSEGCSWGDFAMYIGDNSEYLWDTYSGHRFLNLKYRDYFADFSDEEFPRIRLLLDRLSSNIRYRQTALSHSDMAFLSRVVAAAGALKIKRFSEQYKIETLARGIAHL